MTDETPNLTPEQAAAIAEAQGVFRAFVARLRPNARSGKLLKDQLTPGLETAAGKLPLLDALDLIHSVGPDAVVGRKVRNVDNPNRNKGGRSPGCTKRDWGAPPSEVAAKYREYKDDCPTGAEAVRQTCVWFAVEIPEGKKLEKLKKTLDGWARREWSEYDDAAWHDRHAPT